jgi:hypothetical protein
MDPRAGMDDVEKRKFFTLPGLELQPLDRPARSQSDRNKKETNFMKKQTFLCFSVYSVRIEAATVV